MAAPSKVAMRSILRTKGHIGKEAMKFQFDITIERLIGLALGPHTLKWTRGAKVAYSKPFQIEKKSIDKLEIGQRISLLCTLYRSKTSPDNARYDAKDSKLSLISLKDGKKNEKTIGKVHFNIADYAGVPSSETIAKFKLSNKTLIEVTITCTFIQASIGSGSSVGSIAGRLSASSGDSETLKDENILLDDVIGGGENELMSGEEDIIFSPVTPEANQSFTAVKDFFEKKAENEDISKEKCREELLFNTSKISGSSHEREQTRKVVSILSDEGKKENSSNERQKRSTEARISESPSATSEADGLVIRRLEDDLAKTKQELKSARDLCRISEDTIKSLRIAVSRKEADIRDLKAHNSKAIKEKVNEMNREIEGIKKRSKSSSSNYEKQLQSLRDDMERVQSEKLRLTGELANVKVILQERKKSLQESSSYSQDILSVKSEYQEELEKRRYLESKCQELEKDIEALQIKIATYDEHSETITKAHGELSLSYSQLQQEHLHAQKELENLRTNCLVENKEPTNSKGSRFGNRSSKRQKAEKQNEFQGETKTPFNEEAEQALQEAKSKVSVLEKSKAEAESRITSLSVDLNLVKKELKKSQSTVFAQKRMSQEVEENYKEVCQRLEESKNACADLHRKIQSYEVTKENSEMEEDMNIEGLDLRCSSELREKISRAFRFSLQARDTIRKLKKDLKDAYDREDEIEREANRMKEVVDALTEKAKIRFREEAEKRAKLQKELEKKTAAGVATNLEVEKLEAKEQSHMSRIVDLETAVSHLQESLERARDTNKSALIALRSELKAKQDEVCMLAQTMGSLQRELTSKKEVSENLSCKIREVELENEILKKQAKHEVEIAKEAFLRAESQQGEHSRHAAQYREEIKSLKLVVESLEVEVKELESKNDANEKRASKDARENRKIRDEALHVQRELENQIRNQSAIIESLRKKLQEAAEKNRHMCEEAAEEAEKLLQLTEEKQRIEKKLYTSQSKHKEHEEQIIELSSRIEELTSEMEQSTRKDQASVDRVMRKMQLKEEELEAALDAQMELKNQIREQEERFSEIQRSLKKSNAKNEELVSHQQKYENERDELTLQISKTEEEQKSTQKSVGDLSKKNNELMGELSVKKSEVAELQETLGNLRIELCNAQSKHAALLATSAADASRTKSELTEAKEREAQYEQDIAKKTEVVEELTSQVTDLVSKHAADAARSGAELSEALSREEALREEMIELQKKLADVEGDITTLRSSKVEAEEDADAEISEAVSREQMCLAEMNRLQKSVDELQLKLKEAAIAAKRHEEERKSNEILSEVDGKTAVGMRANKAMAEVLGLGGDSSLSSSNIRKLDIFEKITDERLLDMLVETKMQLALAEEEKLQLEHLIRRVCDGDANVQEKVSEQAEELEVKLTKASDMIESMQGDEYSRAKRKGSVRHVKERQVMEGSQLQFFRRTSARQISAGSNRSHRDQKKSRTRRRDEAPKDEWDLGDGNPSGDTSESRSFSVGSSGTD